MAKASAGLQASVVRLGNMGTQLAGRLWDDAQTLVRGRTPREAASRLAAGALDASAEARRQAEELLRRLGVASRHEFADLGRRIAALDRRLEALVRERGANASQAPFPLTSELN